MSKLDPVKLNPAFSHHASHGLGADVPARHGERPNIARDATRGKRVHDIKIHGGMVSHTKSGDRALSGSHSSAIDALSGNVVVPGIPKSAPGWDSAARSGSPLARPPGSKRVEAAKPAYGMKSQTAPGTDHAALGKAILDAAFSAGSPDDRAAHGRKP